MLLTPNSISPAISPWKYFSFIHSSLLCLYSICLIIVPSTFILSSSTLL
jgi:hypothetical protein